MLSSVLDLLVPERCAACGRPGRGLCPVCLRAASPLRLPDAAAERLDPGVVALAAFAYDGVVAQAIRAVKRPGRHGPAVGLSDLLWMELADRVGPALRWPRTWVPSTAARRRARGAEIPQLLAGRDARRLLCRDRQTHDQTTLRADQRRTAPLADFRAAAPVSAGVVLVDDVRTTGGTARAAAAALRRAGADHVVVVTFAFTRDDRPALPR